MVDHKIHNVQWAHEFRRAILIEVAALVAKQVAVLSLNVRLRRALRRYMHFINMHMLHFSATVSSMVTLRMTSEV